MPLPLVSLRRRACAPAARMALALVLAGMPWLGLRAAEGMWTLDNLPLAQLQQRHGFTPPPGWTDQLMRSAARLGGCSASFVSAQGLVMTNHHCVTRCVEQLSTVARDLMAGGFLALQREQELPCPGADVQRLEAITDVTDTVRRATAGRQGAAFQAALDAVSARLTAECRAGQPQTRRCELVSLYRGGEFHLYRYHRYADVRLVWVPEEAVAAFGGDPDNFSFPRWCLDVALLRVYEDGRPAEVRDVLRLQPAGAEPGELVFGVGAPGSTQRLLTVAQLESLRHSLASLGVPGLSESRGAMLQMARGSDPDLRRLSLGALQGIENGLKVQQGQLLALMNPQLLDEKRQAERALQAFVAARPDLLASIGDPWADIARVQPLKRRLEVEHGLLEDGRAFAGSHFQAARLLVRAAVERTKPDAERLREFHDSRLPQLQARLLARAPVSPAFEQARLALSLNRMRSLLGPDAPLVRQVLGAQSPEQLAHALVTGTRLGDAAERQRLWAGGLPAVQGSDDPVIRLALALEPAARALRARYEAEVLAVEREAGQRIALAGFAQAGRSRAPDATGTLRVSYGEMRGWEEPDRSVPVFTTLQGLYERATGAEPFALPARWLEARERLDMRQRFNAVATLDTIGGNSGSPVINRRGEIIGLLFDGNQHAQGRAFAYDETVTRSVLVHAGAIVQALRQVYRAEALAAELLGGR